jgi:hypothetical protein
VDFLARWDPVAKVLRPAPGAPQAVVRYRHRGTGLVAELVRAGAIGGVITVRFSDGSEGAHPVEHWERLAEGGGA